jgi:hypothetical protein
VTPRESEIDRLFQLPPAEFTAARNALAASAGKDGAAIKSLQKPSVAAWAVNQLYWRRRPAFDKLLDAARKQRAAHGRVLSGRTGDIAAAEGAHREALKAAMDAVRDVLAQAGEPASPATMTAVQETLQALPGAAESFGRLTRPLKPMGFEALAGLVPKGGAALRALAAVPPAQPAGNAGKAKASARTAEQSAAEARREEADRQRRRAALQKQLKSAAAEERRAATAIAQARKAHERARADRARLEDQLQFAEKLARDRAADVRREEEAGAAATRERERLEHEIAAIESPRV